LEMRGQIYHAKQRAAKNRKEQKVETYLPNEKRTGIHYKSRFSPEAGTSPQFRDTKSQTVTHRNGGKTTIKNKGRKGRRATKPGEKSPSPGFKREGGKN